MKQPAIKNPGEGRTIAGVGDVCRFLATGDDTNGKYALWEAIVPAGGGPLPHVHSREEEGFYVLEGEITCFIGDQRLIATAGMLANMPVIAKAKPVSGIGSRVQFPRLLICGSATGTTPIARNLSKRGEVRHSDWEGRKVCAVQRASSKLLG
jgi:hypothetical protein